MRLSRAARALLLAPGSVARAASRCTRSREERWMLCQPREVRRSYVEEVVDRPDDARAQERWMLSQPDVVRLSYVKDVLAHEPGAPPERSWMLRQSRRVRESYVREVLGARSHAR
jgi:hypothetical protein